MSGVYNYDTRGASPASQIVNLERMLEERDARIEALEAQYDLNRAEIRRLGQSFRLVTRETSLIVLDRIEDYVRFEITPPAELLADYERQRQFIARQRGAEKSAHLENVVRRFQEKISWWNRDFPKGDKPAPQPALAPAEKAECKAKLLGLMGSHATGRLPDGSSIHRKRVNKRAYQVKASVYEMMTFKWASAQED